MIFDYEDSILNVTTYICL